MEEYIPHLAYHQIDAATCAHLTDQGTTRALTPPVSIPPNNRYRPFG